MKGLGRITLLAATLLLAGTLKAAVSYRTSELRRLARVVGAKEESLAAGTNHVAGCTVVVDDEMTVTHVGMTLFPEEIKKTGNRPVLEFVERYFLQLKHPAPNSTAELMILSDGVTFPKGKWQDIQKVKTSTPFTLNYQLMRYTLEWKDKGTSLTFSFPGKYQLIVGENLPQAEEHLPGDVAHATCHGHTGVNASEMTETSMKDYYVKKGAWFQAETLNANTFYKKAGNSFIPVVDADFIKESVADIFLCPEAAEHFTADITMLGYGYKETRFTVPLHQWIDYCQQKGCNIFCGIEEVNTQEVRATVLAVNQMLNFNHLLTVTVPLTAIDQGSGTIKAKLNAFIPTHNIINLDAKYKKSNRKIENKILRNL